MKVVFHGGPRHGETMEIPMPLPNRLRLPVYVEPVLFPVTESIPLTPLNAIVDYFFSGMAFVNNEGDSTPIYIYEGVE